MRAWYLYDANDMRLIEAADPVPMEGHLIAKVLCAQPSVTETEMVAGSLNRFGFQEKIEKEGSVPLPGHEYCAQVMISNENSKFQPGERVAGIAKIPCGVCSMCAAGDPLLCTHMDLMGVTIPGCWSELVSLPERALISVDDEVSDSEGACLQPLSDCVGAVDTARIRMGDTIAVFGQGCLGINSLQVARTSGAGMLIGVDIRDDVLEMSMDLGAHYTINARKTDPVAAIKELTNGKGADIVFEAAGGDPRKGLAGTQTIKQALDSVKPGGKVLFLSIYGQLVELPIDTMRSRGLQLIMPGLTTTAHLKQASRLVASGQIQLKPLITQTLAGIERVPAAFEMTGNKSDYHSTMPTQVIIGG